MAGTSQRTAGSIFSSFGRLLLYLSFWNVYFNTNQVVLKSNFHALTVLWRLPSRCAGISGPPMLQNLPGGLQSLPSVLLWGQHVGQPSKPLGPQEPQTQGKPSSLCDSVGQSALGSLA